MTGVDLKNARREAKWTQAQAASKLGLTQAYLSMLERGHRPMNASLAERAMRVLDMPPTALPLALVTQTLLNERQLQAGLGALGYPGYSYLRRKATRNPAQLLFDALDQPDLDVRVVEALPWLTYMYADMDWDWLVNNAKLHDRQNRLGYLVSVASELGEKAADSSRLEKLTSCQSLLERSRLVHEDTLCHDSMTKAERKWLRENRPTAARHWSLLTDLDVRDLAYA
jgi:transcriptional regulator with XRE-family HTH domain